MCCECGGYGDPVDATQIEGGEQASGIGECATTNGNDQIATLHAGVGESLCRGADLVQLLRRLATRHLERNHRNASAGLQNS